MRLFPSVIGRAIVAAAVLLSGVAGVASAQSDPEVRPGWTFTPSLAFGGAWDDNVLLAGEETASTLPDEYVTGITPSGALTYYTRRLLFAGSYLGAFSIYRELSELNSLSQSANANVQYRWTRRLTVSAEQSFATSRETDAVELVGVPFRRIGNRQAGTRGAFGLTLSARTTLSGAYDFRVVDFDDRENDLTFPGGHEHLVSGGLRHQLTPRASVGASYNVRRMLVVDSTEAIVLQAGAGTAEYQFSETVTASGSLGFSRLAAFAGREPQLGLAGQGVLEVRREHFTTSVSYQRSMLPAFGFGGTFSNEQLTGTVQGAFARDRAYWQATAAWRDNDPLLTDPLVPPQPSRRSTWLGSKVGYRLSRWLSVEGYVSRAHQDAQRPGGIVDRTRFGFQVVTSKPLRLAP